jgi:hypothetical protein
MTSPESRSTLAQQLRWESKAALSAADFADRYAIDCCRHAEAVSECAHCTLRFLASFTRRAVDALTSGTPEPAPGTCATCRFDSPGYRCCHREVMRPKDYAGPNTFGCTLHLPVSAPPAPQEQE